MPHLVESPDDGARLGGLEGGEDLHVLCVCCMRVLCVLCVCCVCVVCAGRA